MAEIEQAIQEAKKALEENKYKDALQYCKTALQKDKTNPRILVLIGKSAIGLREYEQAELAFRRILENSVDNLAAWEGLAEVYSLSHNVQGEVEANEHLVGQTLYALSLSLSALSLTPFLSLCLCPSLCVSIHLWVCLWVWVHT